MDSGFTFGSENTKSNSCLFGHTNMCSSIYPVCLSEAELKIGLASFGSVVIWILLQLQLKLLEALALLEQV